MKNELLQTHSIPKDAPTEELDKRRLTTKGKLVRILKYAAFLVISTGLYGLAMFLVYTWLSGYSLLLAYFGNLVLIILALLWDEGNFKMYDRVMQSKEALAELKESRAFRFTLEGFISFKAALYLFYVLILVLSHVVAAYPNFMPDILANFITANEYSILLLIAVDMFSGQFAKDRKRASAVLQRFEKAWNEDEDEGEHTN
ncbi:MAG: hypothetical protein FWG00_00950 [Coriobacteriia bacterium]|nr:hypothetical protein [Coriobacteriia bacterium]